MTRIVGSIMHHLNMRKSDKADEQTAHKHGEYCRCLFFGKALLY